MKYAYIVPSLFVISSFFICASSEKQTPSEKPSVFENMAFDRYIFKSCQLKSIIYAARIQAIEKGEDPDVAVMEELKVLRSKPSQEGNKPQK